MSPEQAAGESAVDADNRYLAERRPLPLDLRSWYTVLDFGPIAGLARNPPATDSDMIPAEGK
jgi:hypothetical protein